MGSGQCHPASRTFSGHCESFWPSGWLGSLLSLSSGFWGAQGLWEGAAGWCERASLNAGPPEAWAQVAAGFYSERRKCHKPVAGPAVVGAPGPSVPRLWASVSGAKQGTGGRGGDLCRRLAREGGWGSPSPPHAVLEWGDPGGLAWSSHLRREGGRSGSRLSHQLWAAWGAQPPEPLTRARESPQRPSSSGWGTLRCPPQSLGIQGGQRSSSKSVYFQVTSLRKTASPKCLTLRLECREANSCPLPRPCTALIGGRSWWGFLGDTGCTCSGRGTRLWALFPVSLCPQQDADTPSPAPAGTAYLG